MMRWTMPLLALISLPGCAMTGDVPPPQTSTAAGKCTPDGLNTYIGRKVTSELGAEFLAKSGARTLRWGPPGSAMTMDYREDRLTVSYDEQMLVTRASCG